MGQLHDNTVDRMLHYDTVDLIIILGHTTQDSSS